MMLYLNIHFNAHLLQSVDAGMGPLACLDPLWSFMASFLHKPGPERISTISNVLFL